MIRFIVALVAVLLSSVSLYGQNYPSQKVDDSRSTQLVIIGDTNCAPAQWFKTTRELINMRSHVQYQIVPPNGQLWQQRYSKYISGRPPIILWQRADGGIIYGAAGDSIPSTGDGLASELKRHWQLAKSATVPQATPDMISQCIDGSCDVNGRPWRPDEDIPAPYDLSADDVKTGVISNTFVGIAVLIGGIIVVVILGVAAVVMLGGFYLVSKFNR